MSDKSIRLDKWLWFARVVKSRTLAQKIIRSGKIRVNREKIVNPAKLIIIEDVLTITLERRILVLKVLEYGNRRGPYVEAKKMYQDMTPVISRNAECDKENLRTAVKTPRPDKSNRRKLLALKNRQYFR
ncbi:MAG: RNA-binding S4 domain-containing protein [Hyphomicrobiales bacterium]|nr:RNA-binding S4 domain-containing protein [Hyphomicrobiales bacterium]